MFLGGSPIGGWGRLGGSPIGGGSSAVGSDGGSPIGLGSGAGGSIGVGCSLGSLIFTSSITLGFAFTQALNKLNNRN